MLFFTFEHLESTLAVCWIIYKQSDLTLNPCWVCENLKTRIPVFQEVVEKNLRHVQDLKRKDDAESVDNDSNMSTSSNLEPFANDDLGRVTACVQMFIIEISALCFHISSMYS